MYQFFNIFFFVFHSGLTLFNLLGWIWRKTRVWNLITLTATAFLWFILGLWYGFGYCPSTDWHWQVRMKLGYYDMPPSYIKFLIDSLTGLNLNAQLVDISALILLILAFVISLILNIRDWKTRRQHRRSQS